MPQPDDLTFIYIKVNTFQNRIPIKFLPMRDLLWGTGLYQELRFVLVKYDGIQSILVSTDLSLDPVTIIELCAHRFKIESMFREFKQQLGGFGYHFWTKSIGKLNHYRKKGEPDEL